MKKVLITGAGRGIGLALTKEFTKNGYAVIATYRNEKSATELINFAKANHSVKLVTADVADEKTFEPLKKTLKDLGGLDILINNAGVIGDKSPSLLELDMKTVIQVFQVNTLGPMMINRLAMPYLIKTATIANVSSIMGSIGDNLSGGYYDYRMSKAALNMFNKCLSKELPNMTCLTLHPGWVQTEMGGAGATVTVDDCARGLFKVISSATLKQSGQFIDYTGKELPW